MDTIARKLALVSVGTGTLLLFTSVYAAHEPVRAIPSGSCQLGVNYSCANPSNGLTRRLGGISHPPVDGRSDGIAVKGSATASDDFVPKDISKAAALGCVVAGDKGPPPFVEVQVFVKTTLDGANWDYRPKVARYPMGAAGVYKGLDECANWYKLVKQRMEEAGRGEQAH